MRQVVRRVYVAAAHIIGAVHPLAMLLTRLPQMDPTDKATVRRTVASASRLMGGDEQLGRRLGVPTDLVSAWGDGHSYPSDRVFMRIGDILMELYWEDSPLGVARGQTHLTAPLDGRKKPGAP